MNKLYERIDFQNGTTPALNDTNLNAMSKAIDDIDDRVISVSDDIMVVVPEIQEMLQDAQDLKDDCETYASNASTSASNAESYAQAAAAGSGGNLLNYQNNTLSLLRDTQVLSSVTISGGGGGGGGTTDYSALSNKPSINNVELSGNKTTADLGINIPDVMGSDAYNASTTYSLGDCCIYNNALYKAIQDDITGVVPTNQSYWEKVTLSNLSNTNLTLESVNVNSNLTIYKYGKLRVARLNSLNITSGQSVQLPSDCYPIVFMSNVGIAGTTTAARINLNPSGQMFFSNGEGTRISSTVVGELVYFVE